MKLVKYFFAVAALALAVSCEIVSEDAFSKASVAPEMYAHNDILMTSNTMEEDVNFSWKPARFMGEGVSYTLMAEYNGTGQTVTSTNEIYYKVSKEAFKAALYGIFPSLPQNATFSMSFYVVASNGSESLQSDAISINIYAYGDAVSAELSAVTDVLVLDIADPQGTLDLLTWTDARLGYNEAITYNAFLKYGDGEWSDLGTVGELKAFAMTTDALNEAAVAAGAPEAAAADIDFMVKAYSDTFVDGVASNTVTINVTTYVSTYPDLMYLPGGYQGWDPATAPTLPHSTVDKGLYQGIIDLTTADGTDVEFKFAPEPAWGNDFAIDNIEVSTFGNGYAAVNGTGTTSANIKVPSGLYNIVLNKKFNTLYMVQIETLSLIGTAVGSWDVDVDLVYDAATKSFSTETDFVAGEFKIRVNHDWTHSAGGNSLDNVSFINGTNLNFDKTDGTYRITLNTTTNPYTLTLINTMFPEQFYVAGDHQGWDPASAPVLKGDGNGYYEGFLTLNTQFKFCEQPNWDINWGGVDDGTGALAIGDTGYKMANNGMNFTVTPGYYYIKVDMNTLTTTFTEITRVGVVGSFCEWGSPEDAAMTYDADNKVWVLTDCSFPANTEYKFRMNSDWAINFGGSLDNLTQDGANLPAANEGVYTITLNLNSFPYTATISPDPNAGAPVFQDNIVVAGDYSGNAWSATDDPKLFHMGNGLYKGALTMYGATYGFKFVNGNAWLGAVAVAGTTYDYTLGGDENMTIPDGTYFWSVDLTAQTAQAIAINKVGIIGSFGTYNWDADLEMTFDATTLTYTVTQEFAAGNEFKIRFNENWDYNLGGVLDALRVNGDNIVVAEAGTYTLVLDMAHQTPTLTMTK